MYSGTDTTLEPFWYLAASPSYLKQVGADVPAELVDKAEQGTRVYLLPNSLGATQTEQKRNLLTGATER